MSASLSTLSTDVARAVSVGRERAVLTQAEVAEAIGVSTRSVQNWEAGVSVPRAKHRRALAALFDLNGHAKQEPAATPSGARDGLPTTGG